jgi:hypothetical protein
VVNTTLLQVALFIHFGEGIDLRDLFDWKNNKEEADMLAALLIVIRMMVSPGYKTPLQILVEVLVNSGRASLAEEVTKYTSDVFIKFDRKEMSVKDYIKQVKSQERLHPINPYYFEIGKQLLSWLED